MDDAAFSYVLRELRAANGGRRANVLTLRELAELAAVLLDTPDAVVWRLSHPREQRYADKRQLTLVAGVAIPSDPHTFCLGIRGCWGAASTPGGWPELVAFPRGDLAAKVAAWVLRPDLLRLSREAIGALAALALTPEQRLETEQHRVWEPPAGQKAGDVQAEPIRRRR